jgi:hypothetical protein
MKTKLKPIDQMTRKEIAAISRRAWTEELHGVTAIVIIPTRRKHDSGYMCIDYVACMPGKYVMCGGGDVIHLEGIGGYGYKWSLNGGVPKMIPPSAFDIDCLPKSGYLRLFVSGDRKIVCESDLSSMCVSTEAV